MDIRPGAAVFAGVRHGLSVTVSYDKSPKTVVRLPLHKRAEVAFKIAVAKAIDERARLGLPIYIWRDGRVVELSPDEVRKLSSHSHGN